MNPHPDVLSSCLLLESQRDVVRVIADVMCPPVAVLALVLLARTPEGAEVDPTRFTFTSTSPDAFPGGVDQAEQLLLDQNDAPLATIFLSLRDMQLGGGIPSLAEMQEVAAAFVNSVARDAALPVTIDELALGLLVSGVSSPAPLLTCVREQFDALVQKIGEHIIAQVDDVAEQHRTVQQETHRMMPLEEEAIWPSTPAQWN